MAKRVLMVITPAPAGDLVSAARSAAAVARESGGVVRMAWMQPLPAPRVDRYDRIVADLDRGMARLTAAALDEMAALAWEFTGVAVERVVRFGRLAAELLIEAHAWRPDLIGLAAPERPGPRHRFRAWHLARAVSIPVVLLPIDRADAGPRRGEPLALPAFR